MAENLRGSCSCGRYNYVINIPEEPDARSQAHVHFGAGDFARQAHASILSGWLKVPLTWYRSTTVSFYPDELHEHIAKTFRPQRETEFQRKFCGFCGSHISYWTEHPTSEQEYMNVTLGSLRTRDLLALEDLDLLPENVQVKKTVRSEGEGIGETEAASHALDTRPQTGGSTVVSTSSDEELLRTSRRGTSGGISWFEDMIEGSQLGQHSRQRKGHGTSLDGSTTISWEVSEYYGQDEADVRSFGAKRKAIEIETDDSSMKE